MMVLGNILKILVQLLAGLMIVSFEQVYGLPILFLLFSLYLSLSQTGIYRYALLVFSGCLVAVSFQLSLAVGVILVWGMVAGFKLSERRLASVGTRLILTSLVASLIIGLLTQTTVTLASLLSLGLSLGLSWVITKYFLLRGSPQRFIRF